MCTVLLHLIFKLLLHIFKQKTLFIPSGQSCNNYLLDIYQVTGPILKSWDAAVTWQKAHIPALMTNLNGTVCSVSHFVLLLNFHLSLLT